MRGKSALSLLYPLFLIPAPGRMSARHGRQRAAVCDVAAYQPPKALPLSPSGHVPPAKGGVASPQRTTRVAGPEGQGMHGEKRLTA
jgi:hypothetical protein